MIFCFSLVGEVEENLWKQFCLGGEVKENLWKQFSQNQF